ncbi:hypothetical protein ACFCV3_39180 [Kribbella sp. NPDC056345]|uniref:hypothetical protein n=1 Tax=Kribbella sp. NPDC056345 TaxID=3345789 RepID=UPI0035E00493
MTVLWPRLPDAVAREEYEKIRAGAPCRDASRHSEQIYAPVGERVAELKISELTVAITRLARAHGYPDPAPDATRVAFDRACAPLVRRMVDITWAEAGSRSVWSFVSLVPLSGITLWRFGTNNIERWLATDLTRHTWARLWWQAVVFDSDPRLLDHLTESDLNQLLERRSIGGDPRLVRSIGAAIVHAKPADLTRRQIIRDVTKRLRRQLAFIDIRALEDATLHKWCQAIVQESVTSLLGRPDGS